MNFAITAAAAALSLVAFGPAGLQMTTAGYLADQDGMSLYVFDKDGPGTSNCYGGCAKSWPPLMVSGNASAEGISPSSHAVTAHCNGRWTVSPSTTGPVTTRPATPRATAWAAPGTWPGDTGMTGVGAPGRPARRRLAHSPSGLDGGHPDPQVTEATRSLERGGRISPGPPLSTHRRRSPRSAPAPRRNRGYNRGRAPHRRRQRRCLRAGNR